jgi:hypothetical protein
MEKSSQAFEIMEIRAREWRLLPGAVGDRARETYNVPENGA